MYQCIYLLIYLLFFQIDETVIPIRTASDLAKYPKLGIESLLWPSAEEQHCHKNHQRTERNPYFQGYDKDCLELRRCLQKRSHLREEEIQIPNVKRDELKLALIDFDEEEERYK